MYKCENFKIYELLDESTFRKYESDDIKMWSFFSDEALKSLDHIRKYFGEPVIVNTWYNGGDLQLRGARFRDMQYYSETSQHSVNFNRYGEMIKRCNGFDINVIGIDTRRVRESIINNPDKFPYITRVEKADDQNRLHFDCKKIKSRKRIYEFEG